MFPYVTVSQMMATVTEMKTPITTIDIELLISLTNLPQPLEK